MFAQQMNSVTELNLPSKNSIHVCSPRRLNPAEALNSDRHKNPSVFDEKYLFSNFLLKVCLWRCYGARFVTDAEASKTVLQL